MKNWLWLIVSAALLLSLTLAGCGSGSDAAPEPVVAADTSAPVVIGAAEAPSASAPEATEAPAAADLQSVYAQMEGAGVLPDMMAVSDQLMLDYYGIDTAECLAHVCMISTDGLLADEVVLVRAASEDAAKTIHALLSDHLDARHKEFAGYLPEQAAVLDRAILLSNGEYIALLVCDEVETLQAVYASAVSAS